MWEEESWLSRLESLRPEVSEELGSSGCRAEGWGGGGRAGGVKSRLPQEHGFLWRR